MKHTLLARSALAVSCLAALTLAACGGGGNSNDSAEYGAEYALQGAQTASVYRGTITGFGSVIVNGVRFSTTGAGISDDDTNTLTHTDLHIGTTVEVIGTGNDSTGLGNATSIQVVRGLQGSISAISAPELTVLGQRVVTNTKTAYQNTTNLAALAVGDTVEAYGATQADGSLLASLIEKKALSGEALPGTVSYLDATAKTFKLNGLTVNYANASVTGTLANGVKVKVKSSAAPVSGVLAASSVKTHDDTASYAAQGSGTSIKIKGIATTAPVSGLVNISGVTVNVSNAVYQGGSSIVAGSIIEARGSWNGSTLIASLIEFEGHREAQIGGSNELYGTISSYVSLSSFVMNGVTVDASTATGLVGIIGVGTYLEVKGNMVGNVFKATRIELKNASAPSGGYYEIYGVVSNFVSLASFSVNGMMVNASGAYLEHPERGAVANGRTVEIKGAQNAAGIFIASKIEIK